MAASNAQLYCDALAARRWHRANNPHETVPPALEIDAIRARHLAFVKAVRGDGTVLQFVDDSIAARSNKIWTVVR